ncbi:MAG: TM1802 family CRISPR-associated protein, partial [Moorellales bacterium]
MALIGRVLSEDKDQLTDLIQPAPPAPKGQKTHIIRLNFHFGRSPHLEAEPVEADPAALRRYCWVGNAVGNRPQKYVTTNTLEYLVGAAPVNLLAALAEMGKEGTDLYRRLSALLKGFFRPLPEGTPVLDPARLGLAEDSFLEDAWQHSQGKPRERARAVAKTVAGYLRQWALKRLGLPTAAAGLWTLVIEDEPLALDPDYRAFILQDKGAASGEANGGAPKGVCTICGAEDRPVVVDFARLDFLKYYINDKIGAASGVSEAGFWRNHAACPECFQALVVAEKYVRQHLGLRVGALDFLVLPAFLQQPAFGRADLENWAAKLKGRVGALANVSQWLEGLAGKGSLEEELLNFLEELPYEEVALLNFLFYRKTQSEFRVLGLAKDVAPGRLSHLLRQSNRLANWATKYFGPDQWWLDLTRIYQLLPLAEGGRTAEFKKVVHVYTALLTGRPLAYDFLIRQFVSLARIFLTNKFAGTNVRPPAAGAEGLALARSLVQANLLLRLLTVEGLLEGGKFLSDRGLALEPELL